ncbi:hypothetical protein TheetDRAFT_3019 [Thermoanaerobacter ethanolicus JW 200]|nr:hypothetical protein TheetDRAFT_3019 [Thermoanaerobacter ethanolicus JW 200]
MFADLKEKHGLRWTTLRGKEKLSMQAMLVFAAMNLRNGLMVMEEGQRAL